MILTCFFIKLLISLRSWKKCLNRATWHDNNMADFSSCLWHFTTTDLALFKTINFAHKASLWIMQFINNKSEGTSIFFKNLFSLPIKPFSPPIINGALSVATLTSLAQGSSTLQPTSHIALKNIVTTSMSFKRNYVYKLFSNIEFTINPPQKHSQLSFVSSVHEKEINDFILSCSCFSILCPNSSIHLVTAFQDRLTDWKKHRLNSNKLSQLLWNFNNIVSTRPPRVGAFIFFSFCNF